MERLTEKVNDYWKTNDKAHIYYLDKNESVFIGNVIDRLAEFEDFMEANKFNNIKELQDALNGKFQGFFDEKHKLWKQLVAKCTKCEKENQALKDRWQKLKKIIQDNINIYNENAEGFLMQLGAKGAETFGEIILDKMQELEKE